MAMQEGVVRAFIDVTNSHCSFCFSRKSIFANVFMIVIACGPEMVNDCGIMMKRGECWITPIPLGSCTNYVMRISMSETCWRFTACASSLAWYFSACFCSYSPYWSQPQPTHHSSASSSTVLPVRLWSGCSLKNWNGSTRSQTKNYKHELGEVKVVKMRKMLLFDMPTVAKIKR